MAKRVGIHTELRGRAAGGSVVLRHPKWADFDNWQILRNANKDYLSPWEPLWDDKHLTRSAYRARLGVFKKMVTSGDGFPFHIFRADDNRLIGACNITHIERNVAQSAKMGYWIGENYARQGFGRAAVACASRFCFEALGLHRVEAAVQGDNLGSIKVLEATGFTNEGTARGYLKINGHWRDHQIYAKLSSD